MGRLWIPAAVILLLAGLCLTLVLNDSKLSIIAAGIAALLPFLIYFGLTRPLVMPYALYAMLVPFDNVLSVSSGATLTKLIGIASTGAIFLWALRQRKFTPPSTTFWLCAIFMLWLSASTLWAIDVPLSFHMLPTYLGLFLLYLVLSTAPIDRRDFIIVLVAMVAGAIGAAAYGVIVFHHQSVADVQALADHYGRLAVQIGDNTIDPNAYSDALLLPFCIVLMTGLRAPFVFHKLCALAGLATMLAAIYVSASRGAIIAVGVSVLWLVIRSRYRLQIVAAAVVPAVIALASSSFLLDRFKDAQKTGGAGRLGIWSVGMEAFRQHWLLGAGIGNYRAVYNTVFIHVYQAYSGGWDRVAHNLVVQTSAELGIVGLVLVLAFWFSNLFLLRHIRPGSEWYDYRIALEAAVIGLFVASLSVDLIWFKYAWLLFGTLAQLRALTIVSAQRLPQRKPRLSGVPVGAAVRPGVFPQQVYGEP